MFFGHILAYESTFNKEAFKFLDYHPQNNEGAQSGNEGGEGDPEKIEVDFEELLTIDNDIVGRIYCPDTLINYPIVQGADNEYYLTHLMDDSWNENGSIFMDFENSPDFSDSNTLIYGHNMKAGAIFAELMNYKTQSFYDAHPYIYTIWPTADVIGNLIANSTFASNHGFPEANIVTLSTRTSTYDNARYVILGELVVVDE